MTVWEPGDYKKFGRQVVPGKTYYTIHTTVNPWGEEPVWDSHVFDKRSPITGSWMSGANSAQGVCLRYGPMYDTKPTHVRAMFEQDDEVLVTPADVLAIREASRKKRLARR
ncbi:hypothetical protein [Streptomyces natalensis]|uniref:Uncharacterized protein n=1 Tax=Streptomyces natalensis ATCC 27448 TaxID=1240678 RepID=A0A0D7CLY1_9ACTN|nr:hypothetical protein [Streptomyces natalensis]KIZ16860.1 hypothetical protein SNA_17870 [Streptomyces natalensis ATCC 27448]